MFQLFEPKSLEFAVKANAGPIGSEASIWAHGPNWHFRLGFYWPPGGPMAMCSMVVSVGSLGNPTCKIDITI